MSADYKYHKRFLLQFLKDADGEVFCYKCQDFFAPAIWV